MTIVVGYVPKPEGLAALHAAVDQARWRNEDLYVLNASPGNAISDPAYASAADLAEVKRSLDESGLPYQLDQHVGGHTAAEEVLAAAEKLQASLIVIGIRHRSATGKLITGSDAQRILLNADCAVLAVKAAAGQGS